MPTTIQEVEDTERNKTILRVEGEMFREDALLLEKIALGMREQTGKNITIDLADLHFLDSDGAPVLKRMTDEHGFEIEGLLVFLQRAVEATENRSELFGEILRND
jgi:anti-anti-sigma regulatory factor